MRKRKGYPACRPSKRVSSKTPKTTSEMSREKKLDLKEKRQVQKRLVTNTEEKKRNSLKIA